MSTPGDVKTGDYTIRFYRSTGGEDGPWALESSATTRKTSANRSYTAYVPLGIYRVTVNEVEDGTPSSSIWRLDPPTTAVLGSSVPVVTLTEQDWDAHVYTTLVPRFGMVTGTVTSSSDRPVHGVRVFAYTADDLTQSVLEGFSNTDGTYSMPTVGPGTRLRFDGSQAYGSDHATEWYDNVSTPEAAVPLSVPAGETRDHVDVTLKDLFNPTISGRAVDPDGKPLVGLPLTYFQRLGGPGSSWSEGWYGYQTDGAYSGSPENVKGQFSFTPNSTAAYQVAINVHHRNEPTSLFWTPQYYAGGHDLSTGTPIEAELGTNYPLGDVTMQYAGGAVTGQITDHEGRPVAGAKVRAYDSSGRSGLEYASFPLYLDTFSDINGHYTIHTAAGPTKIAVGAAGKQDRWLGGASTKTSAKVFDVDQGEELSGQDLKLAGQPVKLLEAPSIGEHASVGRTLRARSDRWNPSTVKKSYQWWSVRDGKARAIHGATKVTYKVTSHDYGKQFYVVVKGAYPGAASATGNSRKTRRLLRDSKISLSATSPSARKVKLSAKIKVKGTTAKGSVRFSCHTSAAEWGHKTVKVKGGKASATLTIMLPSRMTCSAHYSGASEISADSDDDSVTVK